MSVFTSRDLRGFGQVGQSRRFWYGRLGLAAGTALPRLSRNPGRAAWVLV